MKPDWNLAPEWANWFARDENGECWWYEFEPKKRAIFFQCANGRNYIASSPSEGWEESLEPRPANTVAQVYRAMLAASPPSGGEVCIGEVRENGVVWFGQNPHAHPIGTRFYTSPRVVGDDMLDAACEAYADMYDVEYIDGNNRDNRRACIKAALQAALEAK